MRSKIFSSEVELAKVVIHWLEDQHWNVYQEVNSIDIVATQNKLLYAIECKLNWGLKILEQASKIRNVAHYASVAVEAHSTSAFIRNLLESMGIGILLIHPTHITQLLPPKFNRSAHISAKKIISYLRDEHKTYLQAGSPNNSGWSPFKETCRNMYQITVSHPGIEFSKAINLITTHYHSLAAAKQNLRVWIDSNLVPNVELRRINGRLYLYPKEKAVKQEEMNNNC